MLAKMGEGEAEIVYRAEGGRDCEKMMGRGRMEVTGREYRNERKVRGERRNCEMREGEGYGGVQEGYGKGERKAGGRRWGEDGCGGVEERRKKVMKVQGERRKGVQKGCGRQVWEVTGEGGREGGKLRKSCNCSNGNSIAHNSISIAPPPMELSNLFRTYIARCVNQHSPSLLPPPSHEISPVAYRHTPATNVVGEICDA